MHHTHLVLDEGYYPKTDNERAVFKEMQTFMYAVLEDHLKTDKGKSLVSHYENTRDAQSIYRELKKQEACFLELYRNYKPSYFWLDLLYLVQVLYSLSYGS